MKDIMQFIPDELARLKEEGLYTNIKTLESPQGAWVTIDGKKKLNFCSNNYLGLANHPEIRKAAKEAIDKYGVGPGAVRTIAGTMSLHKELEEKLARFKKVEATMVVQSGFTANLSVIPALVGKGDIIYSDELNHASIIDGCRLSRAEIKVYKHNDMDSLEELLKADKDLDCRKLIVTDGVFSMDGDIAPLDKIVELGEKYGAMTMVDDAHGEGVLGEGGRGIVDHFGLHGRCDVEVGTFSKALGVMGGCIAGKKELIEYLNQKARPFLFSSALTVPDTAAVSKAVDLLMESEELVQRLWDNGKYFKAEMQKLGFDTGKSETPITPVMIGDAKVATEFSKRLFDEDIFATKIGYPTVPKGKARIRVMISAAHSKEDLDFALEKFAKVGKEMGLIK
ncbi:8-amino-7-oxononanoate synthase [Anoxybacter fermentans]|uniref:8-amino-7-ketopelargonate synthase n=2 Tax=Anoxybacter fermentans TaxID=1323375 RepID=A0A3Q9HNC4_9FIRM|nr:glycine C-acetyltransferase [Anoxybacter fermentans]AZR71940.1 8-amino-7-oxononanoate synthase [Anoxybacter fermentans]